MSRGALRYTSTAAMPDGMRQLVEQQHEAAPVRAPAPVQPRRGDPEFQEAKALMEVVRAHEADCPALKRFHAIPNGGKRGKAAAGRAKAEGVREGVPDYCLPKPRGGFRGLYIELKSLTGSASREQREWIEELREDGYRAEVCRGWREAWAVLCDYLGIRSQL